MISDEARGACVSSICTMSRTVIPNNKPQYRRVYRRLDDHVMPVRSERITPPMGRLPSLADARLRDARERYRSTITAAHLAIRGAECIILPHPKRFPTHLAMISYEKSVQQRLPASRGQLARKPGKNRWSLPVAKLH